MNTDGTMQTATGAAANANMISLRRGCASAISQSSFTARTSERISRLDEICEIAKAEKALTA